MAFIGIETTQPLFYKARFFFEKTPYLRIIREKKSEGMSLEDKRDR